MQGVQQFRESLKPVRSTEVCKTVPDLLPYKERFMQIARKETGGLFRVDNSNRQIVSDLFYYFLGLPGKLDTSKGLWLEGPCGTGKSTLLNVFSVYMRHLRKGFRMYICSNVTTLYTMDGKLDLFTANSNGYPSGPVDVGFDELGREPVPAGYYGNKLNVFEHILHIRYSYWQQLGVKTYVTTNLDAEEIGSIYGEYIRDRRKEMFNIIPVVGESRRNKL